jgi:hypothetical protein
MSQAVYTSTLLFVVNSILSTQFSRKTLFSGNLGIGVNQFQTSELQIAPGAAPITFNNINNVFAIYCDNPLTVQFNNPTQTIVNNITALTICEGQFLSVILTNLALNSNAANCFIIYS